MTEIWRYLLRENGEDRELYARTQREQGLSER